MNKNSSFPAWGIALGVGCICIVCAGLAMVGGLVFFSNSPAPLSPEVVSTVLPPSIEQPALTEVPVLPEPGPPLSPEPVSPSSSLTGAQQVHETYLYDDFSSDALDWPVSDDGKIILKYEDGQYGFQVREAEYFDWAYVPIDFSPTDISFDVNGLDGPQNGTFGVFCGFQDEDNYNYVEFNLEDRSYVIGQYVNGESIPLTPENAQGQYWQEASALNESPNTTNRIAITCYPDFITLYINDTWVTEASVQKPFDNLGEMALFVYAYSFADNNGYKVFFDNVEVFTPAQ